MKYFALIMAVAWGVLALFNLSTQNYLLSNSQFGAMSGFILLFVYINKHEQRK